MENKAASSKVLKTYGQLTAKVAQNITPAMRKKGYEVIHDHGSPSDSIGKIVSWYGKGEKCERETELSQLDVAIVEPNSGKAVVLIEIEETNDKPKVLLGDTLCVLMGDHICFRGRRQILVDNETTLVVLGKGDASHEERNEYLSKKVMGIKSSLSTGNSKIGSVIIRAFCDEERLHAHLQPVLDRLPDGEYQWTGN